MEPSLLFSVFQALWMIFSNFLVFFLFLLSSPSPSFHLSTPHPLLPTDLLEGLSKEEKKKRGVLGETNELLGSFDMTYHGGFSVKLSATFYINFPKVRILV